MKYKDNIFLLISLLFVSFFCYKFNREWDFWSSKWAALLIVGAAYFAYEVYKRTDIFLATFSFYSLFNSIILFRWLENKYSGLKNLDRIVISYYVLIGLVSFLIISFIALNIKKKHFRFLEKTFGMLCLINATYVLIQWGLGNGYLWRGGFFANGSINGCFIAFTYPFLLKYTLPKFVEKSPSADNLPYHLCNLFMGFFMYCVAAPVLAVLCSKTSVPVGAMALAIFGVFIPVNKLTNWKLLLTVALFIAAFIFVAWFIDPSNLFYSSGRFKLYEAVLTEWWNKYDIWFGTGLGTYPLFGLDAQLKHKVLAGTWAIWMHSDWLQILVELGIVGLILALTSSISIFLRVMYRPAYLGALLSFSGSMLFNYPIHYPIHALLLMFIIIMAYGEKDDSRIQI